VTDDLTLRMPDPEAQSRGIWKRVVPTGVGGMKTTTRPGTSAAAICGGRPGVSAASANHGHWGTAAPRRSCQRGAGASLFCWRGRLRRKDTHDQSTPAAHEAESGGFRPSGSVRVVRSHCAHGAACPSSFFAGT